MEGFNLQLSLVGRWSASPGRREGCGSMLRFNLMSSGNEKTSLSRVEQQMIEIFVSSALVLGLPRSFGQIYGFLFAQSEPKTMEQITQELGISLGSASQGLKALKRIGAVKSDYLPGTRRDVFLAELELKKLLGGFIREQFLPHLRNGKAQLQKIEENLPGVEDRQRRISLQDRLRKLKEWQRKANSLVPLLEITLKK